MSLAGAALIVLVRSLFVLCCIPLVVLPGLCVGKAGGDCVAHQHDADEDDDRCPAIEVENSITGVPAFQVPPLDLFATALAIPIDPSDGALAERSFAPPSSHRPHGPPIYISQQSFLI